MNAANATQKLIASPATVTHEPDDQPERQDHQATTRHAHPALGERRILFEFVLDLAEYPLLIV